MRDLDTKLIAHDATQAQRLLDGDRDIDVESAEEALKRVVSEHVNALLCHIEEREVNADEAYLTGAYAVARWLASCANEARTHRDMDARTCASLAAGAEAMVTAASKQMGVNPNGCDATFWTVAGIAAREAWHTDRSDLSPTSN